MGSIIKKKILFYLITLIVAVSINWLIPRLMPGDPVKIAVSQFQGSAESTEQMIQYYQQIFSLDQPWYRQYINYWMSIFTGDFGMSIAFRKPVSQIISGAYFFDIMLMFPALILSFLFGNWLGALSGVNKKADNVLMPIFYTFSSAPYFWYAVILIFIFSINIELFPVGGAYSSYLIPSFSFKFISSLFYHWILPFLTLFSVMLGQWAIGARNMILYEMGSDYSRYMESMGASQNLIRKYAYKNCILPQITGLAIRMGQFLSGALATEIVFNYPGLGYLLFRAITAQDYLLIQGCFFWIVIFVLFANLTVDFLYVFIDPRVKFSYSVEVI